MAIPDTKTPQVDLRNPKTHPQLVGSGIYDNDYFTANQASLYIGDVLVDDCVEFNISRSQSKRPIYGYASQYFDKVSKGVILCQGSFALNFKESGYLWLILHRYRKFQKGTSEILDKFASLPGTVGEDARRAFRGETRNKEQILGGANIPFIRFQNGKEEFDQINRAGIERLVKGQATADERFEFYRDLAGYATVSNPNSRDRAFENIVEVFEDQVWQEDVTDIDAMARNADDNFFDDFDAFIVLGDYTKPGANHTVRRLRNIHITDNSLPIRLGDGNVIENYGFFCRNII